MSQEQFQSLMGEITRAIGARSLDDDLSAYLSERFPADGETFRTVAEVCDAAIAEGWMCNSEHGGIKFSRVIKDLDGFSVDVVLMADVVGPHHRHPTGEIDMVIPLDADAQFDGNAKGWVVYGPDTAHNPTVSGGEAMVVYLLPGGEIEFTR